MSNVQIDADELEIGDQIVSMDVTRVFDGYGDPYHVQTVTHDLVTIVRHGLLTHIRREDITRIVVRSK